MADGCITTVVGDLDESGLGPSLRCSRGSQQRGLRVAQALHEEAYRRILSRHRAGEHRAAKGFEARRSGLVIRSVVGQALEWASKGALMASSHPVLFPRLRRCESSTSHTRDVAEVMDELVRRRATWTLAWGISFAPVLC